MTCPDCGTDCVPIPDEVRDALANAHELDDIDCGNARYYEGKIEFVRASPPFQESGVIRTLLTVRIDGSWDVEDSDEAEYQEHVGGVGDTSLESGEDFESLLEWL